MIRKLGMISQNNNKLCSEIISLVESNANAMETFVSDIGQEYKILKPLLTGETKLDNDMWHALDAWLRFYKNPIDIKSITYKKIKRARIICILMKCDEGDTPEQIQASISTTLSLKEMKSLIEKLGPAINA